MCFYVSKEEDSESRILPDTDLSAAMRKYLPSTWLYTFTSWLLSLIFTGQRHFLWLNQNLLLQRDGCQQPAWWWAKTWCRGLPDHWGSRPYGHRHQGAQQDAQGAQCLKRTCGKKDWNQIRCIVRKLLQSPPMSRELSVIYRKMPSYMCTPVYSKRYVLSDSESFLWLQISSQKWCFHLCCEQVRLKQRRRTLKNRNYASSCREKKDEEISGLERLKGQEVFDQNMHFWSSKFYFFIFLTSSIKWEVKQIKLYRVQAYHSLYQNIPCQVDEVAQMEEENKRIRDEIESMERRCSSKKSIIYSPHVQSSHCSLLGTIGLQSLPDPMVLTWRWNRTRWNKRLPRFLTTCLISREHFQVG